MKISIITVCYNSASTIADTLQSIAMQGYRDIECIVIDGASTDATLQVVRQTSGNDAVIVSEPDAGVYHAMNKGLALATGDVVGFLNADDVYADPGVLTRVAGVMMDSAVDGCYADLVYVDRGSMNRVIRHWTSQSYVPGLFERGWMPAHPTFFIRRAVYEKFGGFDLRYRLAADFDLMLRLVRVHQIQTRYVPGIWVRMRTGGLTNRSVLNVLRGNVEAYRSCRRNGLRVRPWFMLTKVLSRLPQFIKGFGMRDKL